MFKLFVFGLNYKTANFEIREKLAFSREKIPMALQRLQTSGITYEIFILSTCNRTEVYCITQDIDFVINAICDMQGVCPRTVKKHSYVYSELECANHLFRVISGLESMVLGETEIVAQVKEAVNLAREHNALSTHLLSLSQMALAVEKDVRNVTEINSASISMGHALVDLVIANIIDIKRQKILFIGAGQMMNQVAPHFRNIKFAKKTIINRTHAKAVLLANRVEAETEPLINLPDVVNDYDVIVACCNSDTPLLEKNILKTTLEKNNKLLIIDLSMPLITDLNLRKYHNIILLTIDDIAEIVDVGVEKRKIAAVEAQFLIEEKLAEYQLWLKKRMLTPVIKALRDNAEDIRQEVLSIAQKQLQNGESPDDVLRNLSLRLMNKLLHNPTVNLCATADKLQDNLASMVRYLYNLEY